jgi:hypothetical protein
MMNLNAFSICLTTFSRLKARYLLALVFLLLPAAGADNSQLQAQGIGPGIYPISAFRFAPLPGPGQQNTLWQQTASFNLNRFEEPAVRDTVPHPRKVMFRSMIIPGWGQATNRQYWKIPVVYGLLGGLAVYSFWTHNQYSDYRAAYYNAASGNDDMRFGPTPPNLSGVPPESLRFSRNSFRNQRDFSFILITLAYGLNILDAYIFAHFRDFDVSDDLAHAFIVQPDPFGQPVLSLHYRLRF